MKDKKNIVIYVRSGVVQNVLSDSREVTVYLIDFDEDKPQLDLFPVQVYARRNAAMDGVRKLNRRARGG